MHSIDEKNSFSNINPIVIFHAIQLTDIFSATNNTLSETLMRRTGMPKAVKIQILMEILMDNAQPYTLKEMEKLGSKRKVVSQSIKDVLQELVDDGIVHLEKIGTSNYYWAFPSEANQKKRKKLEKTCKRLLQQRSKK